MGRWVGFFYFIFIFSSKSLLDTKLKNDEDIVMLYTFANQICVLLKSMNTHLITINNCISQVHMQQLAPGSGHTCDNFQGHMLGLGGPRWVILATHILAKIVHESTISNFK
jgi:hypothetical protein